MKNPRTGATKYYAQIAHTTPVMRKDVINAIEKLTSLSSSDVKSCLDALEYQVTHYLQQGRTVRLGDLGSFRPTISSLGTTELEKCNANLIRRVRCRFTPSGQMNLSLSVDNLNFQPYKEIKPVTE